MSEKVNHEHMYKGEVVQGLELLAYLESNREVSFTPEQMTDAVRLEVWHSKFDNPSPQDYSTYELYGHNDELIASKKVMGY